VLNGVYFGLSNGLEQRCTGTGNQGADWMRQSQRPKVSFGAIGKLGVGRGSMARQRCSSISFVEALIGPASNETGYLRHLMQVPAPFDAPVLLFISSLLSLLNNGGMGVYKQSGYGDGSSAPTLLTGFQMTRLVRARYTLEFKQEAVRLVRGGQTVSSVAKTLGLSDQTLHNWRPKAIR
jgi:Transposase